MPLPQVTPDSQLPREPFFQLLIPTAKVCSFPVRGQACPSIGNTGGWMVSPLPWSLIFLCLVTSEKDPSGCLLMVSNLITPSPQLGQSRTFPPSLKSPLKYHYQVRSVHPETLSILPILHSPVVQGGMETGSKGPAPFQGLAREGGWLRQWKQWSFTTTVRRNYDHKRLTLVDMTDV